MTDPHRVYARALALTCDEWMSVIAFPSACATVGKRCPKWVRDLCELAEAIGPTVPSELLDALGRSKPQKKTADCEPNAAIMGKEAGLCVVEWSTGEKVRIMATPFGHAVWLIHQARAIEAHLSSLDGAPVRTRVGVANMGREIRQRVSAVRSRIMPEVFGHDSTTAVPPSGDRDQPMALPPSIDHEGEQDRSSASGVTGVAMPDSVRAKDTT